MNHTVKDFISYEIARNKKNAELFTQMMQKAFGKDDPVFIAHHLSFMDPHQGISSVNEVPSADTLIFDHSVMTAVFGDQAITVMQHLAATPVDSRDEVLKSYIECPDPRKEVYPVSGFVMQMEVSQEVRHG